MVSLMISIEENHYVTGLGIIGLLEAQFLVVVHKIDALSPVSLGTVESRDCIHTCLWILADSTCVVFLPRFWEVDDVREIVVGVCASLGPFYSDFCFL